MVEAVRVLLLLMVGAGIWAAWRRSLFPGTWAHTFHAAYAEDRALLTQARSELRAVDKDQRRAYSEADAKVGSVRGEYEQRVGKLKREVTMLEDPGRGTERGRLGGLVLYEHAVLIFPEGRELPLAGLQARVDRSERDLWLYIHPADDSPELVRLPHRRDPATAPDEIVEIFDEGQVRGFEMKINAAAAAEKRFRDGLPAQLAQAREELAEARKDTGPLKTAEQSRADVMDRNRTDPRRKEALANLTAARNEWQDLTGRRPPK
ncbi:hypothetical protein GTY83_37110 [Streptomyces sp. SID4928]|uniref:hypothetical protein n=1 Tax=unclassified Streptomyces TaxID=2593676 RepID=UPI000203460C|nr:hypothetical protein [Streptomyces sp. ACT-1]EGE39439.1 hypothetical protein SACT1_0015 [Streptomyces sp. ACT-1]EGE46674.1 hypothetical protein SACT1_7398 [Streptomyces sp. ACT-1]MYR47538.1 hypothetical protein [Streptomyces sp. SID4928]MYR54679.1 hypothetical protein [Streptomyces sp. SID4928]